MIQIKSSIFAILLIFSQTFSSADEILRPLSPKELSVPTTEQAIRVEGAEIAWADYEGLRRDFPAIKDFPNEQIDRWLLENYAFIGSEQSKLAGIRNSEDMHLNPRITKTAYRQPGWIRSATLESIGPNGEAMGLMDIKGFGYGARGNLHLEDQVEEFMKVKGDQSKLNQLRIKDHSDGLVSLGESIAEATRQKAAQLLFDKYAVGLETVEIQAIIKLPFNILKEHGEEIPAALCLRQANIGRSNYTPVPPWIYIDEHGYLQRTLEGSAVDMGGVIITHPDLVNNFAPADGSTDPQKSRAWIWGHETADAYTRGDKEAVKRHIDEMLAPLEKSSSPIAEARRSEERAFVRELRMRRIDRKNDRTAMSRKFLLWRDDRNKAFDAKFDIEAGLKSENVSVRRYAAKLLVTRQKTPFALIEKALKDNDLGVQRYAGEAFFKRSDWQQVPAEILDRLMENPDKEVSLKASKLRQLLKGISPESCAKKALGELLKGIL